MPNAVIAAMTRLIVGLQRLTRGRFKMNGHPLLLLRTVGA